MDYEAHKEEAFQIWLRHFKSCAEELGANYNWQEVEWARESFEEAEQLKILDTGHIKLKFEVPCWWAGCKHPAFHGDYYCVVAYPKWEKPHVAFGNDPGQKKLGEEE